MRLFTATWCPFCQVVKAEIEKNNWPVTLVDVDVEVEETFRVYPKQLPVLEVSDGVLKYESNDIIEFLKELHGTA